MLVVNVTFDTGLHVRGGRTDGRSRDDQIFSRQYVTILFYPWCSVIKEKKKDRIYQNLTGCA